MKSQLARPDKTPPSAGKASQQTVKTMLKYLDASQLTYARAREDVTADPGGVQLPEDPADLTEKQCDAIVAWAGVQKS